VNTWNVSIGYHELTKHHFQRYSPGPDGLDWNNQPAPFRRYADAPFTPLELPDLDEPERTTPAPFDIGFVARLFYDSLAISAWKQAGESRWALRVNPSSGNLHPTEAYLLCGGLQVLGGRPGLFHYAPDEHGLERRGGFSDANWQPLISGFPPGVFFIGLSSIPWREAWKYGERAFRYCNHDVGHALAALGISAARLGWRVRLLNGFKSSTIAQLLGLPALPQIADEHPDCLLAITPQSLESAPVTVPDAQFQLREPVKWIGTPNRLSEETVDWPEIAETFGSIWEAPPALDQGAATKASPALRHYARSLLRQRRSAVAMDGETPLAAARFYDLLRTLMPEHAPFDMFPWTPRVHLALFIHRVEGLKPGLYCLPRRPEILPSLQKAFRADFTWATPPACPGDVPLRQLLSAQCDEAARVISCNQFIASDGCFSLGMLAEFEPVLAQFGPAAYPRLFWECGFIGQLLYLEAERAGMRGTGIGCFFDDAMHQILGLQDRQFQSLYHFTIGGPVEDARITTLPAYERRGTRN
jgi:SagB-type dehydrogenase family enzyme